MIIVEESMEVEENRRESVKVYNLQGGIVRMCVVLCKLLGSEGNSIMEETVWARKIKRTIQNSRYEKEK